ncbi:MAG: PilN domain-containing protein [Stagnimonas sp.]|nr:PilN domain-containing protein [Stagnimonas sp.]
MTKINLLDWRAERRARRLEQFRNFMVLGLVVAVGIVALGYLGMTNAISQQQQRNDYLKQQIAEIDQKIKEIEDLERTKQNLLARMRVIEELQGSRSATVHFFDELVNTIPDGITLSSIKQVGDNVTIEGVAESNGRISSYIKSFESSPWFAEPKLVVIKTSEKNKQREGAFTLQVKNLTKAVKEDPAAAAPGAKP